MIAIATGKDGLDKLLLKDIEDAKIVNYKEYLLENQFEIVILSKFLLGDIELEKLFFQIKQNGSRVIYLTSEDMPGENLNIGLCLKYGIYDIYYGKMDSDDIKFLIDNPKSLSNADIQEFFVKYVNEEQLEEKKVALKDLLKNKISKKNTNESSDVKNVTQEIQYVEKIIERVVEKVLYQHPSDYKKVIGITGVPNTGKSITALMIASILSTSNKVAIIDKTENKGLKYYFVDDFKQLDLIKKFQPIQLKKTLHLYIYENNNDFISMISSLKNDYDIVIIDVDNIDKHLATFLDTIYIMTDIAAAHSIYVSTFIGNLINDINLSVKKIKIIYNKVTINDDIKIINKLNVCREVLEDSEIKLELICKELDYFILNQSIKGNKKLVNFDIEAYKADSDYLMQIEKIANDVFLTIKTNIKGTGIKNMFKRSKK